MPAPRVGYRQHVEGLRMLAHELVDALVSGDVPENSEELPQIVPPGVLPGEQDLGGLNPELRGLLRHDQRRVGVPRALGTTSRPPASGPLQNLPSQPPHCESRDASGLRRAWVNRRNYRKFASRWRDRGGRLARKEVRVFVLGSAVKGEELPGSGLDVLIVSGEVPERHPIEFRLATPEECEKVRRVLLDGCEGF